LLSSPRTRTQGVETDERLQSSTRRHPSGTKTAGEVVALSGRRRRQAVDARVGRFHDNAALDVPSMMM
jgi:hypothetical protein